MPRQERSNFIFTRELEKTPVVSATEFLRQTVEQLPSLRELPTALGIGESIPFITEVEGGAPAHSIREVLTDFRTLEDVHEREYGGTIILRDGQLMLGPYCEGDATSVQIGAPLRMSESQTAGGLYIVAMDKTVADLHTHRADATFSIQDLYHSIGGSNGDMRQSYVIRKNGGIDLVVRTQESDFFSRDTFQELANIWDLIEEQSRRREFGEQDPEWLQTRNDYILSVIIDKLQLGFYTNHGNEWSTELRRVIAE